ncbi:MAG: DUF4811 domain-containing protein [Sporolactobacillus sp.]
MILVSLIIAVALFVGFILSSGMPFFSRHRVLNVLLIVATLFIFLGSEALTIMNEYSYYGMKSQVAVQKKSLYSLIQPSASRASQAAMPFLMLRKSVGRDTLYLYNVASSGKAKLNPTLLGSTSRFESTDFAPYVEIKTKQRTFENRFYRLLFPFSGQNKVKLATQYVFHLPAHAQILTEQQLKAMQQNRLPRK